MRNKRLLIMLLLALLAPWAAKAQTTVTIGEGTATSNLTPIGTLFKFSITEQLYTAEEIGTAGTINSVSFYWAYTSAKNFNITMYMANVVAENLSSAGISLADADQVFSGTLSVTETAGWVTINLDNPFAYDGTSNLLIGVNKTGGDNWFSGDTWQYTAATAMARYTQQDNDPYDTSTVPGNVTSHRPNIQIGITPGGSGPVCDRPETLEVSNVTANSATLTWTGGSGTYNVEYKGGSAADWTAYLTNTSATNCNLTGLNPSSVYQARVQSVCDGATSGWKTVSFNTECGVHTNFPITYGFETLEGFPENANVPTTNQFGPCWRNEATVQTGSNSTRVWGTSNSNKHNGSQALVLPDKGSGCRTMLVFPEMYFTNANGYIVSFWIYRDANGINPEGFKVYASDCDTIGPNAVELGHYSRNYGIAYPVVEPTSGWYQYETPVITMTGTVYIIFEGHSYYGSATYVDDIEIKVAPACAKPTSLAASNVTAHEATINWASDAEAWEVQLGDASPINVTEPTYTFTGLTPETPYSAKVRANCDGTYSEWTNPVSFTTTVACPAPTVAVTNITTTTAVVSCTNTEATEFNLQLINPNANPADTTTFANVAMPYTLTGLTMNSSYRVRVKALCGGEDGESAYSNGTNFMTAEECPDGMVCIGTGTATSNFVPAHNYYKYSLTEQIYTAAEIGQAGQISSIEFFKASTTAMAVNLDIYMVSTTKDEFTSNSDWIQVTAGDLVYSGIVTFTDNDWTNIELQSPFNYDGTSNLCIVVDNNTGSFESSTPFRVFTAAKNQAFYYQNDDNNLDPTTSITNTGNRMIQKNRIRLAIGEPPACPKPTGLAVDYVEGTTATVTWNGEATSYNIDVNGTVTNDVTSPYQLTSLALATTYEVKVQANCGASGTSEWASVSFTTDACMPEDMIIVNYVLTDSYGDGWDGNAILVVDETCNIVEQLTIPSGSSASGTLKVCSSYVAFYWQKGEFPGETSWVFTDDGNVLFSGAGDSMADGDVLYTIDLNPYLAPSDFAVSNIGSRSAVLGWTENGTATAWQIMLSND